MMHANDRKEQDRGLRGRHRRGRRPQADLDGQHAVCARTPRSCSGPTTFPDPVVHVSIEPKTKVDQEKMAVALQRLAEEDPTFQVRTHEETGQTIVSGMGELHLEVIVDRMKRERMVEAAVGRPQVAYRERSAAVAEGRGQVRLPDRRLGQYGVVYIDLEPAPGEGFDFDNKIKGGAVPRSSSRPVEKGIEEALESGVKAGYPMVDVRADADRRQLPRHRLLVDGVQDRRPLR